MIHNRLLLSNEHPSPVTAIAYNHYGSLLLSGHLSGTLTLQNSQLDIV